MPRLGIEAAARAREIMIATAAAAATAAPHANIEETAAVVSEAPGCGACELSS